MAKKNEDVPMSVSADGILETKLTRSEAIELLLAESERQIEARIKENEKEVLDLRLFSVEEMLELANAGASSCQMEYTTGRKEEEGNAVRFWLPAKKYPAWLKKRMTALAALHAEHSHLQTVLWGLRDKTKAKLQLMKQVLEQNEEGRDFLERISRMSVALNERMLGAAKEPPAPRLLEEKTTVTVKTVVKEG